MLRRLSILNYLLIEHVEIDLRQGFSVLTGETGSGKSMLVDAIQLALGQRVDPSSPRDSEKRCIVELEIDASHLQDWFLFNDVSFDLITSIRRQIEVGGRSRAFVNDTPVRLDQLKELASRVVHIHSQHQTRLLNDSGTILRMLDRAAGLSALVTRYSKSYGKWKALNKELIILQENLHGPALDVDYLRFQSEELKAAQLEGVQVTELENELNTVEQAEALIDLCDQVTRSLDGDGQILASLHEMQAKAVKLAPGNEQLAGIADRLRSAYLELKDLNSEVGQYGEGLTVDDDRAEWLRQRVNAIQRLLQKHHVREESELVALGEEISAKITAAESADERIATVQANIDRAIQEVARIGEELTAHRSQAVPLLEKNIVERLQLLGMPKARFRLELREQSPNEQGQDGVTALFAADPDRPLGALRKIASGGELSRVMLAMISSTASAMQVGSIIFDEVDTGVSGEVADRVGMIIKQMSNTTQVIVISHLPQVASKADHHLYVVKQPTAQGTASVVRELDPEERVQAVAEMLSGSSTSPAALENARELIANN